MYKYVYQFKSLLLNSNVMIFCSSTDFSVKPWSITIFSALVQGYPDKYYLYFIHRDTYPYKYLASNFYAYQFMYTFKVFDHTLIVETIIYMYLLCFCPYINCCNHTKYLFSCSIVVDYYIQFSVIFYQYSLCTLQSHKTCEQRISVRIYDNSN